MIKNKIDRLDPKYFRTTPKNSWELFKWLFTEPIKIKKFSDSLSKKETLIWVLKIYTYIIIFSFFIFIISNFIIAYFDIPSIYPEHLKKV